jgi:hypothetical protein
MMMDTKVIHAYTSPTAPLPSFVNVQRLPSGSVALRIRSNGSGIQSIITMSAEDWHAFARDVFNEAFDYRMADVHDV